MLAPALHSAAQIAHDWTVERLACLQRTVGHVVRTQFKVTASRGSKRGDIEILQYLHHAAGGRNLVINLLRNLGLVAAVLLTRSSMADLPP